MKHALTALALASLAGSMSLQAETAAWPSFRGPNASGLGANAHPPVAISPTQLGLWSADVPWSPSSPAVAGDRLFLTTLNDGKLEVRAHATGDGKTLWTRVIPAETIEDFHLAAGSPAASTPATDGQRVVSYFGSTGLICHDLDGRELWRQPMPVAATMGNFGSGTSPVIAGDRVILNRDVVSGSSLLAFDLATGRKLWETPRPGVLTSYSTPIIWKHGGGEEIVVAGSVVLRAYDLKTGSEKWMVRGLPSVTCTTPVLGEAMLYVAGWAPGKSDAPFPAWTKMLEQDKNGDGWLGPDEVEGGAAAFKSFDHDKNGRLEEADWNRLFDVLREGENNLLAIRPGGRGDVTESHIAWQTNRGLPYVPSPLYHDGRIYLVKDGGMISSYDARTGEPAYVQERLAGAEGTYYASPVAANGHLYLASLKGKLTVVKAGGTRPEVVHQADFGERIDATPALVGNRIYLRTKTKLLAFSTKN